MRSSTPRPARLSRLVRGCEGQAGRPQKADSRQKWWPRSWACLHGPHVLTGIQGVGEAGHPGTSPLSSLCGQLGVGSGGNEAEWTWLQAPSLAWGDDVRSRYSGSCSQQGAGNMLGCLGHKRWEWTPGHWLDQVSTVFCTYTTRVGRCLRGVRQGLGSAARCVGPA